GFRDWNSPGFPDTMLSPVESVRTLPGAPNERRVSESWPVLLSAIATRLLLGAYESCLSSLSNLGARDGMVQQEAEEHRRHGLRYRSLQAVVSHCNPGTLCGRGVRLGGRRIIQKKIKSGAFARLRIGPDPSAVAIDDPLHDCEADTGPRKLYGTVQPLKHAEQLFVVLHVEPRAVVLHVIHSGIVRATFTAAADLDDGGICVARELDCVAQEVRQCVLQ